MAIIDPSLMVFEPNIDHRLILAQRKERPLAGLLAGATQGITQGVAMRSIADENARRNQEAAISSQDRQQLISQRRQIADLTQQQERYGIAGRLAAASRQNPALWARARPVIEQYTGMPMPEAPDENTLASVEGLSMDTADRLNALRTQLNYELGVRSAADDRAYRDQQLVLARDRLGEDRRQFDQTYAQRGQEFETKTALDLATDQWRQKQASEKLAIDRRNSDTAARRADIYEKKISGGYPKPPPPAGVPVGRSSLDEEGNAVSMISDGKGGVTPRVTPRKYRPAQDNPFASMLGGEAMPAGQPPAAGPSPAGQPSAAGGLPPGSQVGTVTVNGRPVQAIRFPDGRLFDASTGAQLK